MIDKEVKRKLLDLLQNISYAHEDGGFWKSWSDMHKYLSDLPEKERQDCLMYDEMECEAKDCGECFMREEEVWQ